MKQHDPNKQLNKQLFQDFKHYALMCGFGEICAFAFIKASWIIPAGLCAFLPACMIIVYLISTPPCDRQGGKILSYFALTAIVATFIGMFICVNIPSNVIKETLTINKFFGLFAISFLIFFCGIKSGIFPLPPRKNL